MSDGPWVVVGLGNADPRYVGHRHNVGFHVLDELARRVGGGFKGLKGRADVLEGRLAGQRVVLAKPRSWMNESGGPVTSVLAFYKADPAQLVVVHDELDIPFGTVRLKRGGTESHNGLRSVSKSLGTREYLRVRVGIGRPPGRQDTADFVLQDFSKVEQKEHPFLVDLGADAVEALLSGTLEAAQNRFHAQPA